MVWFLERNGDILTCEIRQAEDSTEFEFEVSPVAGPRETLKFGSPGDLIIGFLGKHAALEAQGWRPRIDR